MSVRAWFLEMTFAPELVAICACVFAPECINNQWLAIV